MGFDIFGYDTERWDKASREWDAALKREERAERKRRAMQDEIDRATNDWIADTRMHTAATA